MVSTGSLLLVTCFQAAVASLAVVLTGDAFSSRKYPARIAPPKQVFVTWLWWFVWLWAGFMSVVIGCYAVIPRLFP